jgi:tetratricopeptide (TPR) repeat protein
MGTYRYNRGLSLFRLDRLDEAMEDFNAALELDPRSLDAGIEKVNLLVELDRFDEALPLLEELEGLEPASSEPPFYRGAILARKGDLTGALAQLEESLRRDPDSVYTLNNMGNILMDLGRLDEALACFDAILQRTESYPLARYNRACVFALQGKAEAAARELAAAAAQEGHFLEDARLDPDFDLVRNSVAFRRMVGGKKAGVKRKLT